MKRSFHCIIIVIIIITVDNYMNNVNHEQVAFNIKYFIYLIQKEKHLYLLPEILSLHLISKKGKVKS